MSIKINDPDTDPTGTHLVGYVDVSYATLVAKLGPSGPFLDDYKSDAEWTIAFDDGAVATIYNYKDGKNYLGDEGAPVESITNWHIGGRDDSVVPRVRKLLSSVHDFRELSGPIKADPARADRIAQITTELREPLGMTDDHVSSEPWTDVEEASIYETGAHFAQPEPDNYKELD